MTTKEIEDKKLNINDIALIKLESTWVKREEAWPEIKSSLTLWSIDIKHQKARPEGKGWKKLKSITGSYMGDNYYICGEKEGQIKTLKIRVSKPFAMSVGYLSLSPEYVNTIKILKRVVKSTSLDKVYHALSSHDVAYQAAHIGSYGVGKQFGIYR